MSEWIDKGTYVLNTSEQRSPRWHDLRFGRLTASNVGTAIGVSKFSTPEELADTMAGITVKEFTETQLENMNFGTQYEPVARDWYQATRSVVVEEVGIAIPKWNPMIGGSLDGNVVGTDGCCEIKGVKKMYKPLIGRTKPDIDHKNIWPTHYCQIQSCLRICNKRWCDYIVFCPPENRVYVERIDFNPDYWNNTLYPGIQHFIQELLIPRLQKVGKLDKIIYPPTF